MVEVLQGLKHPRDIEAVTRILSRFKFAPLCGQDLAVKSAANSRLLRRQGITIRGTIDVIIATWCIENDVPIIHNDRDMRVMEDALGLVAYR